MLQFSDHIEWASYISFVDKTIEIQKCFYGNNRDYLVLTFLKPWLWSSEFRFQSNWPILFQKHIKEKMAKAFFHLIKIRKQRINTKGLPSETRCGL